MIYKFIDIINNYDNNDNNLIILDKDIEIIEIQKKLCKRLNNCYIYYDIFKKYEDNDIGYIIYKNKVFMIIKQMINKFYIKYINII